MTTIDCACVIHGNKYSWDYVERLYAMIMRNTKHAVNFHVFTEHDRSVPTHMIKHALEEWPGISGPRKAWWYKMQLFNTRQLSTRLLYFDLDVVITAPIDWIFELDNHYFWTIRDFKYLWKPAWQGINSSVMCWDTVRYHWIWKAFLGQKLESVVQEYYGDQDFLTSILSEKQLGFINDHHVKSWRWQIKDGGINVRTRAYKLPGSGSVISPDTKLIIFHGDPKPHEINDAAIQSFWNGWTK